MMKTKRIIRMLCLSVVLFTSILVFSNTVVAETYNGDGGTYGGCVGTNCACNQGSSQLCLWDNKNHVLLKVSLYYFPSATGIDGGVELGSEVYVKGNWSNYKGYFTNPHVLGSDFAASGTDDDVSSASKAYFYDTPDPNFYNLFEYITGLQVSSNAEIQDWMEKYCQTHGYGNTLSDCHTGIPGKKGFRIVIQPILTGVYGSKSTVKVGTVKSIYGSFDIWNRSTTVISLSGIMYLNQSDLGFSAASGGTDNQSLVANGTSGYGLNMFDWPINITIIKKPCNPDNSGVATCCSKYSIKYATDANNYDTTKVTRPMTASELSAAGCTPTPPPPTCSYKLDKSIPSTCTNKVTGLVGDNADWKCVFTSTLSNREINVQNNYIASSFSNKYCSVYCKETIVSSFPGTGAYSDAGTYFTITSLAGYQQIGPIKYTGTSTCRVTSKKSSDDGTINVAQFVADFNAANQAVLVAFDNWQYGELQNEVINAATSRHWSATCTDSWPCKRTATYTTTDSKGKKTTHTYCAENYSCSASRSGTYYTYNNKTYYGATFTSSTGISDGSCGCSSRCGSSCSSKVSLKNVAALKAAYISAVNARTALLEELKKCNNFYKTYNEFKPNVTFTYNDVVYKGTYTLQATGSATSSTEYFKTGASTGGKNTSVLSYSNSVASDASNETQSFYTNPSSVRGYSSLINYYDCGTGVTKQRCTKISQYSYPVNSWYEQTTKRVYTYKLKDGLNNYVDKPSGFSSSTATDNYDYIPFSNLPVHYSTKPGDYTYSINTTSFGNGDKFNSYIIGNTGFNYVSYHASTKYECTYKISSDKTVICTEGTSDDSCSTDTGGTDLLYRTISLYYPFAGQNATTTNLRAAGENWSSDSSAISKYIYNSRGVSYYQLYKLQPMYEIDLTPALMRKIKAYNQTQNTTQKWYYKNTTKAVYATVGYSDFSLSCTTNSDGSKSQHCTSSIIRSWGVKGCAISKSGYSNCGTTVAW